MQSRINDRAELMKMKNLKIICFLFYGFLFYAGVKSEIDERFKADFFKIYKHTAIEAKDIVHDHVTPDKIKYFLFTRENPENYTAIDPNNPKELERKDVQLVFIIHGWTENRTGQWYEDLKNAFLKRKEEYYVVQVDWAEPADQIYTISSWNTKDVGNIIGQFVVDLHKNHSIPLKNFLFVGHSLGGQICGYVGKKVQELVNQKLPRIIALDPAGPLFTTRPENERLNKNDAEVVEVIHTDGGTFGYKESIGTIDFFPNGGGSQPGCKRIDLLDITSVTDTIICDHHRSWEYFIEAVLNPGELVATKCSSWLKFETNTCDKPLVSMGDLETKEKGDFYLDTNKDRPFSRKRQGFGLGTIVSLLPH